MTSVGTNITGRAAEDIMGYCSITASSVAAAAQTFVNDPSPAAARAQKQQRRALQALMLACMKTAAAAAAAEQQGHSWGRHGAGIAANTVEASMRLAKQLALPDAAAAAAAAGDKPMVSWQDPAASWMLLLARGMVGAGQLLLQRQADMERHLGSQARVVMVSLHVEPLIAAFKWLQQQLPHLQLPGAVAAVGQASSGISKNKQHRQLLAQAEQLQETLAQNTAGSMQEVLMHYDWQRQMVQQLVAFGQALCYALPSRACCNNPGCSNLARLTERELVSGKGCVCSR
jgi:hypothetical protein